MARGRHIVQIACAALLITIAIPVSGYMSPGPSHLAVSSDLQEEEFVQNAALVMHLVDLLDIPGRHQAQGRTLQERTAIVLKDINALRRRHGKELLRAAYVPGMRALILMGSVHAYLFYRANEEEAVLTTAPGRLLTKRMSPAAVIYPGILARSFDLTGEAAAAIPQEAIFTEFDVLKRYGLSDEEIEIIRQQSAQNGFEVVEAVFSADDAASAYGAGTGKRMPPVGQTKQDALSSLRQVLHEGKAAIIEGNFITVRNLYYALAGKRLPEAQLRNVYVLGKDLDAYDPYFPRALSEYLAGKRIVHAHADSGGPPLMYRIVKEFPVIKDDQVFYPGTKITCAVEQASPGAVRKITYVNNTAWEEESLQETEEDIARQLGQNPTGIFVLKIQIDGIQNQIKPKWKDEILGESASNNGWIIVGVIFSPIFSADDPSGLPDKHHKVVERHYPKGNSLVDPKVGILPEFQGLGLAPFIVGATDDYARKMELDNVWAYSRPSFLVRYVIEQELRRLYETVKRESAGDGVSDQKDIAGRYEAYLQGYIESVLKRRGDVFRVWFTEKCAQKKLDLRGQYLLVRKEEYREACAYNPLMTLNKFFEDVHVPQVVREYIWVSAPAQVKDKLTQEVPAYEDFLAQNKTGYIAYGDPERDKKYYEQVVAADLGYEAFYHWLREVEGRNDIIAQLTDPLFDYEDIDLYQVNGLFKKFLKETKRRGYDLALRVLHSKAVPVRYVPGGRPDDYLESDGNNFIMEYRRTPSVLTVMNTLALLPAGAEFSAATTGVQEKKLRRAIQEMAIAGFSVSLDQENGMFKIIRAVAPLSPPGAHSIDAGAYRACDEAA
jgi:hypothetical protein